VGETALTTERAIEMDARGLPTTFVPGAQPGVLHLRRGAGRPAGPGRLVGGMCETDFSGYPTAGATRWTPGGGAEPRDGAGFVIDTPLMRLTKAETWALAHALGGERWSS
jgi:7-cyano-7-deazaguanine synthase